jgi:Xanthine dehydrogenase, molybdopterin-binding subunit B
VVDDKVEVWAPTQVPRMARALAAQVAGVPVEAVTVHVTLLGGGFGRRGRSDYVRQAVLIAKEMPGTPVKLCGRAKRTCSTAPIIRSRSAN